MTKRAFITVLSLVFLFHVLTLAPRRVDAASVLDSALLLTTSQAVTYGVKSLKVEQKGAKSPKAENALDKSSVPGNDGAKNVAKSGNQLTPGERVSLKALALVGSPYRWGGESVKGFDCSGFTRYIYRNSIGVELPRTSSKQAKAGIQVKTKSLTPGDIVYFRASRAGVGHVGIFVGSGKFVHATASKGVGVSYLSEKYWIKHYLGAVRVIRSNSNKF